MDSAADDEVVLDLDGVGELISALIHESSGNLNEAILNEAESKTVASKLDYPGYPQTFAKDLIGLVVGLGGTVNIEGSPVEREKLPSAGYLVPKTKIHIRVKKVSWKTAVALVPIIATVVATGGSLAPLLGLTPLLYELKEAITPLGERDRMLVVALTALHRTTKQAVTPDQVWEHLPVSKRGDLTDIESDLQRLSGAGVLEWTESGYRTQF